MTLLPLLYVVVFARLVRHDSAACPGDQVQGSADRDSVIREITEEDQAGVVRVVRPLAPFQLVGKFLEPTGETRHYHGVVVLHVDASHGRLRVSLNDLNAADLELQRYEA